METEENSHELNNSSMCGQIENSAEVTPSIFASLEDMESSSLSTVVELKSENKKRNKSFQKKNREQMRSRIKNSLFSNSKNTSITCSMDNLVETLNSNQALNQVEQTNSLSTITPSLVLSSDQTICDIAPCHNVGAAAPSSFAETLTQKKLVFLRLQSYENLEEIEREKEQGIFKISGNFGDFYELQETLGEGCVGLVKKAIRRQDGNEFAVKTVRTRDEETIQNIKQEFLHLKQLNHRNIVKVYELYIDNLSGKIHSVMELIQGKEMFEVIHQLGHYSELVAIRIFSQILDAIAYMHLHNCCHRDLKPNNILCNNDGTEVKITDFNVSKFSDHYKNYQGGENITDQSIKMWTYTGTMAFSAPEVFNGDSYDETIDMWSAGCILFTMLSGREPFQAEYVNDLVQQICQGKYNFDDPVWNDISSEAKDLITKCLTVDSTIRIKPEDALKHAFITRARASSSFSSAIDCASPLKIPLSIIEQPIQLFRAESIDEEKNEGVGTPVHANLCRKQLSNNIDRLIVNNSKKINKQSNFGNNNFIRDRPRAVSSICIQFNNKMYENKNSNNNTNNLLQLYALDSAINTKDQYNNIINSYCNNDHDDDDDENNHKNNNSNNNNKDDMIEQECKNEQIECSQRKRKKKYTIIFSKQDCFSNHVDTDSADNLFSKQNENSNEQTQQQSKNQRLSINSKKKRESNQNMTTSSSSSSSLTSSLSPKNTSYQNLKTNLKSNNQSKNNNNNNNKQDNLYWDDTQSQKYSVQELKTQHHHHSNTQQNKIISKQDEGNYSIIKTAFNSFKKRFIFSTAKNLHSTPSQRSYSCDIQNNEEFLQIQDENITKDFIFLKGKENSTFQNSLQALSKFCAPALNRLIANVNTPNNINNNNDNKNSNSSSSNNNNNINNQDNLNNLNNNYNIEVDEQSLKQ